MCRTVLIAAVLALLAGCGAADRAVSSVASSMPEPTLVLRPGVAVLIDGAAVAVVGTDRCPDKNSAMRVLFGDDPQWLSGESGCLVLAHDRDRVEARFRGTDGRVVVEQWTIIRTRGPNGTRRTSLRRPDGSPVVPAGAAVAQR